MPKLDLSDAVLSPREAYIDTQRAALSGTRGIKLDKVVEETEHESESVYAPASVKSIKAEIANRAT